MIRGIALNVLVGAALLIGSASQATAQASPGLEVGSHVRLVAKTVAQRPLIGTILRLDQTALQIQAAGQQDPVLVPRAAISKLEVSLGRRSRLRGAGIGALVGFGIGVIPAFVPNREKEECRPTALLCDFVIPNKVVGMVTGAIGAGIGAGIGAAIPPGHKWRVVATGLRVSVGGTQRADVGVFWSFEF